MKETDRVDVRLPRYEQIREALKHRIIGGDWNSGMPLPAETELAREYGVALGTMRSAIEKVVGDGLLHRVHGKGTFVRGELQQASMFRFFRFRETGDGEVAQVPRTRIHALQAVDLPDEVVARLETERARRGIFILRTRTFDSGPALLERIWLPHGPFKALLQLQPEQFGDLLYPLFRERCGVVITRASETIRFGVLGAKDASLLGLKSKAPAAVIERTAFSLAGKPVEFRITQGDAHRFHYNVELK